MRPSVCVGMALSFVVAGVHSPSLRILVQESLGMQIMLLDADRHLEDNNRNLELARLGQDAAIRRAVAQV